MQLGVYLIYGNMRDMKMTDFPTYPWETLDHVSGQQLLLQDKIDEFAKIGQ